MSKRHPLEELVFQIRLGTLLLGVAGIAVGLAIGRESAGLVALSASSAWIAIGLLQQTRDLWQTRCRLATCDRPIVWGWRYAISWRVVIVTTIAGYWLVGAFENAEIISFPSATFDYRGAEALSREGLFYLALVIGLASAPWVRWRRPQTGFATSLDVAGWAAGICLACLALSQVTLIEVLVHLAVSGIELAQPYRFAGELIYDMDVAGDRQRTHVLAFLSVAMIGLSLITVWLAARLARNHLEPHRRRMTVLLVLALATSCGYVSWVHAQGLHGVSPFLADAQILRPWPCWLFAAMLMSLFTATVAYGMHYHEPDASREPIVVWHRGAGAYLNESRLMLIALSVALICLLIDITDFEAKDLLKLDAWSYMAEMLFAAPEYSYLPLAVLWLSIVGIFSRRQIADIDRQMTPVSLSPLDFMISWAMLAGIMVGLVEAVAWTSFTLWLL